MALRAFEPGDAAAVSALIERTIDACYPAVYSPRAVAHFKQFHSIDAVRDRASAGVLLLVEDGGGEIVATGTRVGQEISGVFVAPERQGNGLGDVVMDELEAGAVREGCPLVHLYVSLPSRGFYEHRGYTIDHAGAIDVGEGQSLPYWEAEKPLGGDA